MIEHNKPHLDTFNAVGRFKEVGLAVGSEYSLKNEPSILERPIRHKRGFFFNVVVRI